MWSHRGRRAQPKYAYLTGVGVVALVLVAILLIANHAKGFIANTLVLRGSVAGGVGPKANHFNALNLYFSGSKCRADEALAAAKMADAH